MNPILGLRAIRHSLRYEDLFKVQLRALLRASTHGRLKIMFPLISSVTELRQAKDVLDQAKREIRDNGHAFNEDLQVGIMIEVPSAAAVADHLAREVDFFSIGTNDLIQFLLAVDRDNAQVSYLYKPLHPAVVRTLKDVIDAAHGQGIRVGMCGEMAAEPAFAMLLVGLGLDELSMNPAALPLIKRVVRTIERSEAISMVDKAMSLATAEEIEELVSSRLQAMFPTGYF